MLLKDLIAQLEKLYKAGTEDKDYLDMMGEPIVCVWINGKGYTPDVQVFQDVDGTVVIAPPIIRHEE